MGSWFLNGLGGLKGLGELYVLGGLKGLGELNGLVLLKGLRVSTTCRFARGSCLKHLYFSHLAGGVHTEECMACLWFLIVLLPSTPFL